MNKLKDNYSQLDTEELIKLSRNIVELQPEAVTVLQQELISRGENTAAIHITTQLVNTKYIIAEDDMINYIMKQINEGVTEYKIDEKLKSIYKLEEAHLGIIKAKLKATGKNNLFIGGGLIIVPILFGLYIYYLGGVTPGITILLFSLLGIGKTVKGYKQVYGLK